ncbi:aminomethyl-transferring glycine dehydrogenase subunit GcvPB, partial [Candidatus Bipolaricaulota bacterium]|nr:aminomethyl-transferring glycine dehydrogenase subunit GcvPB [Candidatus Bipolaricaulota bacterium]
MKTIFDAKGKREGKVLPALDVPQQGLEKLIPHSLRRSRKPRIPALSEPELVRHYTRLSKLNYGVDDGLYPLGSCTMKYNPKVNEDLAQLPAFADAHPLADERLVQGSLALLHEASRYLCNIAGLSDITLQPAAGAHGELTGMFLFNRYFRERGESKRKRMLLPDSAHGTNPASATTSGFSITQIPSGEDGMVDLVALRETLDETVAGIMLTVPNTLGIFEERILEITQMVHAAGGLCYFDGANLNAFLGQARPGDMGADAFHFNLHKTLSAPHGGGGPGSGPVAVSQCLVDFLPVPRITKDENGYHLDRNFPRSIGCM